MQIEGKTISTSWCKRLIASIVVPVLAIGVAWLVLPAWADVTQATTLISGQGGLGAHDGANHFSIDGGASFDPAFIIPANARYGTIPGTKWITLDIDGTSLPSASSDTPQVTTYRTFFNLPNTAQNPGLVVTAFADNAVCVYLNGNQVGCQTIGDIPANYGNGGASPSVFTDSNATHFVTGRNELTFVVTDFGGFTGLDYMATVTDTVTGNGN